MTRGDGLKKGFKFEEDLCMGPNDKTYINTKNAKEPHNTDIFRSLCYLRSDNSGGSVNKSNPFSIVGMMWCQKKDVIIILYIFRRL